RDLTANISHDLKTPLTIMSVHLEELCEAMRHANDDELSAKANAAWRKNIDLQRITQNLFEVSRIETGRSIYNPEWVPLSTLMTRVQDRYEDFLDGKGLYLDIGYGEDAYLWLDERKIWSVFDNIVYNAVRYTRTGGISVTADTSGETATVTVRDTGTGIARADLPHIFDRFYKVESARGAASGDSGLGLYIVKSVMESLEGGVRAESEPGGGTAIVLAFKKTPIPSPSTPTDE
ncbi:HAMP domain-containing histidine kinase, partial [Synergistaceae bacterium OttesenSCG-928-I11]|nr:HAMP domain-containing histidine kinase [Synergistaceae bacterium OttesenSCG-928-I11]